VRYLRKQAIDLPWDLELISFCDEEGSHYGGTFGSRAMMGLLSPDEIRQSGGSDRPSFAEDLIRHGGDPDRIGDAVRDPSEFEAYLELHIEQGRVLENENCPIGTVTGIAGIYRDLITIVGETDHAGATPMALRDDALVKAAPLFTLLPEWVRARSEGMVGTIGRLALSPNVANAVPGKCEFVVELRSMRIEDVKHVSDLVTGWVANRKGCSVKTVERKESVALSRALIDRISQAAEAEGLAFKKMHSGAGHDAQTLAPFLPSGMIFVPSREGKSHSPEEWTDPKHASAGCRVLVRTILELARKSGSKGYLLGDPHDTEDDT
jgi:hydantoinase/carbamoylase family amidase